MRQIPLVGASFWAAQRIKRCGHTFAFSKYCSKLKCKSNSASTALNKWLKPSTEGRCVVQSFTHSLRDRLRPVKCPADIIDALGGWLTDGIGQSFGKGQDLQVKSKWMKKINKYD